MSKTTDDFSRDFSGDLGPNWSLVRSAESVARGTLPEYMCAVIDGVAKLYKGDQLIQEIKIDAAPGDVVRLELDGARFFLNGVEIKPR